MRIGGVRPVALLALWSVLAPLLNATSPAAPGAEGSGVREVGVLPFLGDVAVRDWTLTYTLDDNDGAPFSWAYGINDDAFSSFSDMQFLERGNATRIQSERVTVSSTNRLLSGSGYVLLQGQAIGGARAQNFGGYSAQSFSYVSEQMDFIMQRQMRYEFSASAQNATAGLCRFYDSGSTGLDIQTVSGVVYQTGILETQPAASYHIRCTKSVRLTTGTGEEVASASYAYSYELLLFPLDYTSIAFADGQTLEMTVWDDAWSSWNVYRGDLATLLSGGDLIQAPGSNPVAAQDCGVGVPSYSDIEEPFPGQAFYYLVTGTDGSTEEQLGLNRVNTSPCPPTI